MNAIPFKIGDRLTSRPGSFAGGSSSIPWPPTFAMTCVSNEAEDQNGARFVEVVMDGTSNKVRIQTSVVIRIRDLRDLLVEKFDELERMGKPAADASSWREGDAVRFLLRGRKKSVVREGVIKRVNRKTASVASWTENPFTYRLDHVPFGELERRPQ